MKRLAAHIGLRLSGDADLQQHPAVEGAFAHKMTAVIGQPDRVVRPHMNSVRPRILAFAPGAQEIAVAVEDADRVSAAAEGVDIVAPVDADGRDIGVEFITGRQFRPVLEDLVAEAVGSENDRHGEILRR
jgi:hypothetical protein